MPDGSVLENVILPRYDQNRKLTTVLHCEIMTLVSSDVITGKAISIEAFNPDQSVKGRMNLQSGMFDQRTGIIRANEEVTIQSERLLATGTGLVYALDGNKGFLVGPAKTTISNPPSTAMNTQTPGLRTTALLGASLLPLIAQTPPPPALQVNEITRETTSTVAKNAEMTAKARNDLREILKASEEANQATAKFLNEADLIASNDEKSDMLPTQPKPLEFKADPEATLISCLGGIYLDPDISATSGVLVYLKGVTVKNPQIDLKGANELKVFFERPPANKEKPKKVSNGAAPELTKAVEKDSKNLGGIDLGDPKKIVATGPVVIELKPKGGGEPTIASASFFSYDLVTGDIVLRGGFAWIIQGDKQMRAKQADLGIYIKKDMTFTTDKGPFEQQFRLPKK